MRNRKDNPKFLNEFLDYTGTIQNKAKGTIIEYNYDLAHFFQFLEYRYNNDTLPEEIIDTIKLNNLTTKDGIKLIDIRDLQLQYLKQITLQDIHAFLHFLKNEYDALPATLARKVASIRSFFSYICTIKRVLEQNPTLGLETPKMPKRLPKYLDLNDSLNLIKSASTESSNRSISKMCAVRNVAILTLFLNCGLRLSELVNINIRDINFFDNILLITGKGDKQRSIYLNDACIQSINDYLKVRPKDVHPSSEDALFISSIKKRISKRAIQQMLNNEIKKSNIQVQGITPHKLRHTAATLMFQYGQVDIRSLQKVLGHASVATTEIYTHVNNQQVREAINKNPLANIYKENKQPKYNELDININNVDNTNNTDDFIK